MALNVISNFAANVAHRNLVMSDMQATSSLSKLSSGLRVVSAKDDAASLAIGNKLRAEVAAMQQASQNASQASSLLQIADGALGTVGDILVRMKALAVQASSGQFGTTERAVLDSEFQALNSEIDRIALDTEFNGTQLISGGTAVFDSDGNSVAGDTILRGTTGEFTAGSSPGISVNALDTNTVATDTVFRVSFDSSVASSDLLSVTNVTTGDRQTININTAFNAQLTANGQTTTANTLNAGTTINVDFDQIGVTLQLDSTFDRDTSINTEAAQTVTAANFTVTGSLTATAGTTGINNTELRTLVSTTAATTYAVASGNLTLNVQTTAGATTLAATSGMEFSVDGGAFATTVATDIGDGGVHTVAVRLGGATGPTLATLNVNNVTRAGTAAGTFVFDLGQQMFGTAYTSTGTSQNFSFKVGTGAASQDSLVFSVSAASTSVLGTAGSAITDATLADTASSAVTTAINTVNSQRSNIGAAQNRLDFASNNLAASIENAEAARSGLLDLDVAKEISAFTSKNILVQTGISMLAQANQVPQNLLQLFR